MKTPQKLFQAVGDYCLLLLNVLYISFRHPPHWKLIRTQLFHIGVLSLPVVAFTGFSTGLVLAAQSFFQLSDKGLASATGLLVGKAMMTELGPVLTAFMVTGRVGAAMCAELGTMRVTEQIDALRTMATNPVRHLIAPRFIAGITMMPLLTVFSTIMGIVGGYLIAVQYFGMQPNNFIDPMRAPNITTFDYASGLVKAFFFGFLIVTISCFKGLRTSGGAAGVGRSTTNSVVICYSFILLSNFFLTMAINILYSYLNSYFDIVKDWIWG